VKIDLLLRSTGVFFQFQEHKGLLTGFEIFWYRQIRGDSTASSYF